MFQCKFCKSVFAEKEMLKGHEVLHCIECGKWFSNRKHLQEHERSHASVSNLNNNFNNLNNFKCRRAFKGRIETYFYENKQEDILQPKEFFELVNGGLVCIINNSIKNYTTFKYNMELQCEYIKIRDEDIELTSITHRSKMSLFTLSDHVEESLKLHYDKIINKMSEFQERDSGWSLIRIKKLEVNINMASFIRGSKYIPLPQWLIKKQACFNILNDDDYCFKWSVIASFSRNKLKIMNNINIAENCIQVEDQLINFEGLEFPLKLKDISKFEKNNTNISINVFGCEGNNIVGPYYLTNGVKEHHVNLLLLSDEEWFHYVLITDISR